jgi:hypothetical protein|tara:strand:+ start:1862 stop:2260 length:399 start_codon:yes stop_codon:yes gene_type:complete
MDIDTIVALNKEAGNKAKRHGIKPTTFESQNLSVKNLGEIVNLGNYIPKGWKRLNIKKYVMSWELPYSHKILNKGGLFVDSSGFGQPNEPALTIEQLISLMAKLLSNKPSLGFGIISQGQFQLTIGVFECQN